jgi:hypothetical protein
LALGQTITSIGHQLLFNDGVAYLNPPKIMGPLFYFWYFGKAYNKVLSTFVVLQFLDQLNKSDYILSDFLL